MAFNDVIKPGDKIDIRIVQQVANENAVEEPAKVYKSKVLDIEKNGELEISMPTENSKLILLPLGVRLEFVFYSGVFLYKSIGQIKERYKKDNIYTFRIELHTQPEKFQRREFYRYECALDFSFFEMTETMKQMDTAEDIFEAVKEGTVQAEFRKGVIVDISGGGIRFTSEYETEVGTLLMSVIHLAGASVNKEFHIAGSVIACRRIENIREKRFESRMKFMIRDDKMREEIIRYIFEEERLTRQKVKG